MRSNPGERVYWVDSLKAIGITFVVLGHTRGLSPWEVNYLYSFHMPLFFFISGLLLKRHALDRGLLPYVGKYARRLFSPYVFFGLLTYIAWVLVFRRRSAEHMNVDPLTPLFGMLYGTSDLLLFNGPLWFFPCLFLTALLFYLVTRAKDARVMAALLAACGVAGFYSVRALPFRLPWNAELALTTVVFFGAGYLMRDTLFKLSRPKPSHAFAALSACLLCQALAVRYNGRVDLATVIFGNLFLLYLGAFSGIFFWVVVAMHAPYSRVATSVSVNTDVIFPLHTQVFSLMTAVGVIVFGLPRRFHDGSLPIAVFYTVVCMVTLTPLGGVIRRHIPWAVGVGKAKKHPLKERAA